MSWRIEVAATDTTDFRHAVRQAVATHEWQGNIGALDAAKKAVEVAADIVASGVLGSVTKFYAAEISGHANSNHEPTPGWVNDYVTITVRQAP